MIKDESIDVKGFDSISKIVRAFENSFFEEDEEE
jgi:hypothetical protein